MALKIQISYDGQVRLKPVYIHAGCIIESSPRVKQFPYITNSLCGRTQQQCLIMDQILILQWKKVRDPVDIWQSVIVLETTKIIVDCELSSNNQLTCGTCI